MKRWPPVHHPDEITASQLKATISNPAAKLLIWPCPPFFSQNKPSRSTDINTDSLRGTTLPEVVGAGIQDFILYTGRGKNEGSPKSHLASFEEQILPPKLAWSNLFPWGEQGIRLWLVKSCSSADFQQALKDIRVQIWWKVNETFTPKSLRFFWNFPHLSSKLCSDISLGNLRGWYYYTGINSHFIDEETEVKWRAKGHTRSCVKGFRWRRISKGREGFFIT